MGLWMQVTTENTVTVTHVDWLSGMKENQMSVVDKLNEIAVLAIELYEEWETEGNKDASTIASPWVFSDDENGAMDIMEWAFQVRGLAESYELCTNLDTCVICGTECPVELVRWGDHVGRLSPKQMDKQIPACKDCTQEVNQ